MSEYLENDYLEVQADHVQFALVEFESFLKTTFIVRKYM